MQCPSCERELTLIGAIGVHWDIAPGEQCNPKPATKTYTCNNSDCEHFQKALKYDVDKQEWK